MARTDTIVRFEEHPQTDGSLRVFLAANQTDDLVPSETHYWEHWLTDDELARYQAATTEAELSTVIVNILGTRGEVENVRWKEMVSRRPPPVKRREPGTVIPDTGRVITDDTGTRPVSNR